MPLVSEQIVDRLNKLQHKLDRIAMGSYINKYDPRAMMAGKVEAAIEDIRKVLQEAKIP